MIQLRMPNMIQARVRRAEGRARTGGARRKEAECFREVWPSEGFGKKGGAGRQAWKEIKVKKKRDKEALPEPNEEKENKSVPEH